MKRAPIPLSLLLMVSLMSGCAAASRVVMTAPGQGQSSDQHQADKGSCDIWAKTESGSNVGAGVGTGAIIGGVAGGAIGAVVGLVLGSFVGQAGHYAAEGAALGATAGGLGGAGQGAQSEHQRYLDAYRVCMQGRGYAVR